MTLIRQLMYAVLFSFFFLACNTGKKELQFSDSSRYDLQNPITVKLPGGLAEISGIVYYPKDSTVFAIEDEEGFFYKIQLISKAEIKKWRFDKKHDFEDLALHDSIFYVLISNGDIVSVQFVTGDSMITSKFKFPAAGKNRNEFETLYYDDSLQQLVLLCKNCDGDGGKKVTAWGYNITTHVYTPMIYAVNSEPVAKKLGLKKIVLRPSGAAINPVTDELYILSSINNLILITDRQGNYRDLFVLDPVIYKQPEGIAFTPSGDIIISNESKERGLANILVIKNKKKGS